MQNTNGELWHFETVCKFCPDIFDIRPSSASRDLQSDGVRLTGSPVWGLFIWAVFCVFSCSVLFVRITQVIGSEDRLRNDLDYVW